ncbi:hypothetical protein LTR56_000353 [Elasticomyces elasticus]|nr:hypothetical protein LTR56_000353 [Elasticomyces elasticus]KAK3666952.1 hypothetical protein LTR22_002177 [Elasticomyces elasticus]KAK4933345.1 hypothetical protein LTR49_000339 [Elasticomyces elasticus]KAK5743366.1 hypothetical protein LTS12_023888 [Elasticomyces elasticus]
MDRGPCHRHAFPAVQIDRPNDGFHGSCQRTSAQLLTPAPSDGEEAINPAVASDDGKIGITRDPANDPCRFPSTLPTLEPIFNKYLLQYGIAYNSQSSIRADVRLIYLAHVECLTAEAWARRSLSLPAALDAANIAREGFDPAGATFFATAVAALVLIAAPRQQGMALASGQSAETSA